MTLVFQSRITESWRFRGKWETEWEHNLKQRKQFFHQIQLFTTSAVDNIDHNPSATTATGSLHGTAISLFQHPTRENHGQERAVVQPPPDQPTSLSIAPLPKQYAEVLPVQRWKTDPSFPSTTVKADDINHLTIDLLDDDRWLKHVKDVIDNNGQDYIQQIFISWAAFHAS